VRYFFDSSALAKLYHPEAGSDSVNRIFRERSRLIFVAKLALIELISVAGVKQRTGSLTREGAAVFLRQVTVSAALGDFLIHPMHRQDYETASRLLTDYSAKHNLRTLDALHLACAIRRRTKSGIECFVTADRALAEVAALDGFDVVIPGED
jgi:predicted nucleic acid-binding protein